ncbi:MAG: hypothetical protein AB1898_15750 [Acidobacteriota bacterium]
MSTQLPKFLLLISLVACLQVPTRVPTTEELQRLLKELKKSGKDYDAALGQAVKDSSVVRQFRELFPTKNFFFSNYRARSVTSQLLGRVPLHSRYVLSLDLNIRFNDDWTRVTDFAEPAFQLTEVEEIQRLEDGRLYVSFNGDSQKNFGKHEWDRLYEASGDFSVLGIQLRKDQPIPLFDEYWKKQEVGLLKE